VTHNLPDIDRIDLKILSVLQQDGRISNLKLAESVALSPTAVLARVQRLSRDGYILGYEARLNPLKLGAGMTVFVEVLLDRTTPHVFEAFKAAVQVYPEIMEWPAALTTCSKPAWPTWQPTATLPAPRCGNCPACAKPELTR
jgi:Lrp/AsnC family leucine-responsive transcriptional regulator